MNTKTIAASVALIAASLLVLAGCAGGTSNQIQSAPSTAPTEAAQPTQSAEPTEAPLELSTEGLPDVIYMKVTSIHDAASFTATAIDQGSGVYLDGAPFEVRIPGVATPTVGECGHDEAIAWAQKSLETGAGDALKLVLRSDAGNAGADADGVLYGIVSGLKFESYQVELVQQGYAYLTDGQSWGASAQDAEVGLWAICDSFGQ